MPEHKPKKISNQKNDASILEEPLISKPKKQAELPPSLNGIPKQ
ncbi:hypothetical protein J2Z69_001924 [Paenibacillus shirakamiensis]|uniref:Uncharacterized protein n=1 Tax=Paenibacillus shirakamiensis TaxID=1265935 RepID=A0ABS4JGR4_9BACL|nr:hypothetical protein [Paenibacillus shirakamiensis]MBP2000893.1 hypothetical protein [Paenibacillus shirakamiensis]